MLTAVGNVNGQIADAVNGRAFADLARRSTRPCATWTGRRTRRRLGANAIVGVSMAAARAAAASAGVPLWQYLTPADVSPRLPVPHFNVVNGGAHAPNSLDFQEFMIAPLGAPTIAEAVRAGAEVYAALKRRLHGEPATPPGSVTRAASPRTSARPRTCSHPRRRRSPTPGTPAGRDGVAIALDPAASEFYRDGAYHVAGRVLCPPPT